MSNLIATFHGTGLRPQWPPNPAFPQGMPVDISAGAPGCVIELAHPAPSIGQWVIECAVCGLKVAVTAAGRVDDPSTVKIPCSPVGRA